MTSKEEREQRERKRVRESLKNIQNVIFKRAREILKAK